MSTTTAADALRTPMRELTIAEWHDLYGDYEGGHCELVRGQAIVTPTESTQNLNAAMKLLRLLSPRIGARWTALPGVSIQLAEEPAALVRVPDLLLVRSAIVGPTWKVAPADISLVVEVVSPSSVERDRVTKRAEYAAVGIPNYLLIELGPDNSPQLWLFDTLLTDETSGITTYADPTGDGTTVTLHIPGADPITITADDLR